MLLYDGDRAESLHNVVAERFAPHRLTVLSEQRLNGRFRSLHEGRLSLYELGYGAEVQVTPGELPDFYNIQVPVSGSGVVTLDGAVLPPGPWLAGPGQRISMTWDGAALNRILIIPARLVEPAVQARSDKPPGSLPRFAPALDSRNPAVATWLELVLRFQEFVASPLGRRSPLGLGHFERLLVDTLVDAQPSSWCAQALAHGLAAAPSALRRAVAFCEEHAHEAVSVADIAAAARVSPQSLRAAFRAHLDTTPLAFLRRVRLDLAHHDLRSVAQGRASGTVTDIAVRWGFTHLGRFSAHYRDTYGESPSATLRSAF
ncbi:AraC family transcriptional regulator [Kitasatospora sp. NPDC002227]|uniref:AraC family transcriptional regulator n=1 Tax=Kitasatospora sp. NPDC002227 TaxID=3154773 RepID=UPI003330E56D